MDRDEELRRRRGEHTRSYSQDKPIGSGDNAKAIVRGVKQWLPDIPGAVGDLADMLYAGGANVLQGQKRRSIAPLGAGPAIRRAIAKKSPLEQVEMRATPETDWVEEGVRFANPAMFMSPKNIAQLGGLALAGGVPGAAMAVVKPRGGNWYTGSGSEMESAIKGLLKDQNGRGVSIEWSALNKWLEGPLQRYVKRDMATEADPIRKLLEQDPPVSHMSPQELLNGGGDANWQDWIVQQAVKNRFAGGYPREGIAKSGYARAWEDRADGLLTSNPASLIQKDSWLPPEHPMQADWVKKLHPDEPIYDFEYSDEASSVLGLDHLRDELWNAVRAGSDLPANLRLKPEDFQQMGIEKAVRHVAKINNWRANAKAAASQDMLGGPGVKLLREYPENNPKGLRWVELNDDYTSYKDMYEDAAMEAAAGAVQKQLKYEGDTMGHCVGGYCDDVLSGTARIFSLRDAKGEPHVTVAVAPTDIGDIIQQIKGKQNLPPKDEYLPFVQDFIRKPYHGGQWHDEIGDFGSTGLLGTSKGFYTKDEAYKMLADPAYKELGPELLDALDSVHTPGANPEYDAILEAYRAQNPGYAQGGLVGRQDFGGVVGYILD